MSIEAVAGKSPLFILENFFSGRLRGGGVTLGRMGGLNNRFTIESAGRWDASANTLSLSELLV